MASEGWDIVYEGDHVVSEQHRAALDARFAGKLRSRPELGRLAGPAACRTLPVHRWSLYKEAYAPGLVEAFVDGLAEMPSRILDVFAGAGTTLLTARERGIDAAGVELLPYAHFIAQTKLSAHLADVRALHALTTRALDSRRKPAAPAAVPAAGWALPDEARSTLGTLYAAILAKAEAVERDLALLALLSIVEECSVATKDGTSVRRITSRRRRGRPTATVTRESVRHMFRERVALIARDLHGLAAPTAKASVVLGDARDLPPAVLSDKADAAMFSPPYPNRYDYSAIYQLELAYGFVEDNQALKELRRRMLRSHLEAPPPGARTVKQPALDEFLHGLLARKQQRDESGRKFRMISGYFEDMRRVLEELTAVLRPGSPVGVVVGTQCFAGQHLPTDLLIAALAEDLGMTTEEIWVLRTKGMAVQQRARWGNASTRESLVLLTV